LPLESRSATLALPILPKTSPVAVRNSKASHISPIGTRNVNIDNLNKIPIASKRIVKRLVWVA
jgi:hypothetical protein